MKVVTKKGALKVPHSKHVMPIAECPQCRKEMDEYKSEYDFDRILEDAEKVIKMAPLCGGTVSSSNLRHLLEVHHAISPLQTMENVKLKMNRLNTLIAIWRKQLMIHNEQDKPLMMYNIETGKPI